MTVTAPPAQPARPAVRPLRLLQVGLGGWGRDWTRVTRAVPDVEPCGWVDAHPAALQTARETLALPADRLFSALDEAIAATAPDALLVTANLAGHVPVALAALEAGLPVLVEKPFAPSLDEARRVVDAAAARGLTLMVSQNYRYHPAPRAVAGLVRDEALGPVGQLYVDFRFGVSGLAPGSPYATGPHPLLLDMAIHHLDLMRLILGQEARRVSCHAWNPTWSPFRDPASAALTVELDGGAVASYRATWVSRAPRTLWAGDWRLECERGLIEWTGRDDRADGTADRVTVRPTGRRARRIRLEPEAQPDRVGALAAFAHAVRTGTPPECSGRDNLRTLAMSLAAIRSATEGRPVEIEPGS